MVVDSGGLSLSGRITNSDVGENGDELGEGIDREIARVASMDWRDYRRLLLYQVREARAGQVRLERKIDKQEEKWAALLADVRRDTDSKIAEIHSRISRQATEIALLQFKSGMWGALAGIVVAIGAVIIKRGGL
jgi:hypothetical protein